MVNDGGSAFPVPHCIDGNWVKTPLEEYSGMSLRDYFAAKAMQSFMQGAVLPTKQDRDEWLPKVAEVSYEVADAMLEARKK